MPGPEPDFMYADSPEVRIGPDGRAVRLPSAEPPVRSSIPDASFAGPSRPTIGMGGSVAPDVGQRAVPQQVPKQAPRQERALTPEEMMAMAQAIQDEIEAQQGNPHEPAVHPDMNVPYWLQSYAKKEGIDTGVPQPHNMTRDEAIDNNKYMNAEEKARMRAYKPK